MLINVDKLEDYVKPQIENTIKYLKSASSLINSINIPSDFSYGTKLNNISVNISDTCGIISNIENWLDNTINDFLDTEYKNKILMESITGSTPSVNLKSERVIAKNNKSVSTSVYNVSANDVNIGFESAFNFAYSNDWIIDSVDVENKTASKTVNETESSVSLELTTGANVKENVTSCVASNETKSQTKQVGKKTFWGRVASAFKSVCNCVGNFFKKVGASIANAVIGLVKGLCQLIESLLDFIVMLGTGVASVFTGIYDGVTYAVAKSKGNADEWTSATSKMWKGTMAFVAEDHVENAYKCFYSKTSVGQWLDENAVDFFKSDGTGTEIMSGIGYTVGIIVLTIATVRNRYCRN